MNIRLLLISAFILVIIGGLIAGIYAGSIQRALTLPTARPITAAGAAPTRQATNQGQSAPTVPAPTPTPKIPQQLPTNLLAMDNFQRTPQPLWGTSSDGRLWEGDANMPNFNAIFSIAANHGRITGQTQNSTAYNALLGPQAGNIDVLTVASMQQFNGKDNIGLLARWTDVNHWYKALIDGKNLNILLHNGAASKTIATIPFAAQSGVSYSLRFRIIGATLYVRAWQSNTAEPQNWMLTVMDTTFTTGRVGLRVVLEINNAIDITSFTANTSSSLV